MAIPEMNPTGMSNFLQTTNMVPPGVSSGMPVLGGGSTGSPRLPIPGTGTGGPGTVNFGNTMNPFAPTTSMNPGGTTAPGASGTGNFAGLSGHENQKLTDTLRSSFHSGYGDFIASLLQSGGGYNAGLTQQNVDATISNLQHQIQTGYGTLQQELGAQGVSPLSSVNALESSNYEAQAINQENQITAQMYFDMWNQSMGREFGLAAATEGPVAAEKAGESWKASLGAIGSFIGDLSGAGYSSSSGGSGGSSWGFTL